MKNVNGEWMTMVVGRDGVALQVDFEMNGEDIEAMSSGCSEEGIEHQECKF